MKNFLILAVLLSLTSCGFSVNKETTKTQTENMRSVAVTENIGKLIELNERRGCCSHHGGVSHCSGGTLYCNDGWVSGCGC